MNKESRISGWRVCLGFVGVGAALLAACGGGTASVGAGPALSIEAGGSGSDTIDAVPLQALVVKVIGEDGEPEAGLQVIFDCHGMSFDITESGRLVCPQILRTDGKGRATAPVKYGSKLGDARVIIRVPLLGIEDTARYTVRPGAPHDFQLAPSDTTVLPGATFSLRVTGTDRYGNQTDALPSLTSASDVVTVDGADVFAANPGIGLIEAAGPDGEPITSRVVVVPEGTVVWTTPGEGLTSGDLIGNGVEVVSLQASDPAWSPDGTTLVFVSDDQLYLLGPSGSMTHLDTGLGLNRRPEFSPDGAWIYFHNQGIFRIHPDGTGLERISPEGSAGHSPTISPDGSRVAYIDGFNVVVQPIGGDPVPILGPTYVTDLDWSPSGEWIAIVERNADEVWVIRPDGQNPHQVGRHGMLDGIDWSPDSRWIVGAWNNAILIDVAGNVSAVLSWLAQSASFAWRP